MDNLKGLDAVMAKKAEELGIAGFTAHIEELIQIVKNIRGK